MTPARQGAEIIYQGLWGILAGWFRVPRDPPSLPAPTVERLRPSDGWLRYLKFKFWLVLGIMDGAILVGWTVIMIAAPVVGAVLAVPALLIAVVPDIFAYVAIHLKYDTTWYILSDRAMRIRTGVWHTTETTITYENVQNVEVRQGPVQRHFGIADLVVTTAGGGGSVAGAKGAGASSHLGVIFGLEDAARVRDLILARAKGSRHAGLGDDGPPAHPSPHGLDDRHVRVLREIRDRLARA